MNEPSLQNVLPATSREAVSAQMTQDFKSTLKLPKGVNRHLIARAIDKVLLEKENIEQVRGGLGLVASETEYMTKVIEEFRAWEVAAAATAPVPEPAKETP